MRSEISWELGSGLRYSSEIDVSSCRCFFLRRSICNKTDILYLQINNIIYILLEIHKVLLCITTTLTLFFHHVESPKMRFENIFCVQQRLNNFLQNVKLATMVVMSTFNKSLLIIFKVWLIKLLEKNRSFTRQQGYWKMNRCLTIKIASFILITPISHLFSAETPESALRTKIDHMVAMCETKIKLS